MERSWDVPSGELSCGLEPSVELPGEAVIVGRWRDRFWRAGEAFWDCRWAWLIDEEGFIAWFTLIDWF